jgi:hypothetical protein
MTVNAPSSRRATGRRLSLGFAGASRMDDGLLDAMAPGSAVVVHTTCSPRTIELLAARGEPRGGFAAAVGEFLGKDLAVVRQVAADLGTDLGALNDAHDVLARLLQPPAPETSPGSPASPVPPPDRRRPAPYETEELP